MITSISFDALSELVNWDVLNELSNNVLPVFIFR